MISLHIAKMSCYVNRYSGMQCGVRLHCIYDGRGSNGTALEGWGIED